MKTKICTNCKGEPKPLSDFYKHIGYKYDVGSQCKECIKRKTKKYKKLNRDKINKWERDYRVTYTKYKKRSKLIAKNLTNGYVAHFLSSFTRRHNNTIMSNDIPTYLIELKRIQLKIHRELQRG